MPKFIQSSLIWLILILALGLRLYQISTPLADWHSFRQADTASVAREYVKHGINLLEPKYQDLSNIQSGQENPEGFRMVEFPFVSGLVALTYPQVIPLHIYYRLIDIAFSLGSLYLLYLIVGYLYKPRVAILAAALFALLPYNVYYSRTVLPEIPLVFFSLLTMYSFIKSVNSLNPTSPRHSQGRRRVGYWLLSGFSAALALLLKPTAAIFFPPLFVYLYQKKGFKGFLNPFLIIWCLVAGLPLLLWRQWILQFPAGIPASEWLFNGNGIRLRPAWFRWLFYERLTKLILGYLGMIPFIIGLYSIIKNLKSKIDNPESIFLLTWFLSSLAYLIVIATGNVQHDYYQIILIPFVSVILALGFDFVWSKKSKLGYCLVIVSCFLGFIFAWQQISGYYHINNWAIIEAGAAVDRLTPPNALVIAPYRGDTAFLYATNRRGWPIGFSIDKRIAQGAQYYVSVNFDDEARELEQRFVVVEKNEKYIIIKLQNKQI